jgi:hypothetical protein
MLRSHAEPGCLPRDHRRRSLASHPLLEFLNPLGLGGVALLEPADTQRGRVQRGVYHQQADQATAKQPEQQQHERHPAGQPTGLGRCDPDLRLLRSRSLRLLRLSYFPRQLDLDSRAGRSTGPRRRPTRAPWPGRARRASRAFRTYRPTRPGRPGGTGRPGRAARTNHRLGGQPRIDHRLACAPGTDDLLGGRPSGLTGSAARGVMGSAAGRSSARCPHLGAHRRSSLLSLTCSAASLPDLARPPSRVMRQPARVQRPAAWPTPRVD